MAHSGSNRVASYRFPLVPKAMVSGQQAVIGAAGGQARVGVWPGGLHVDAGAQRQPVAAWSGTPRPQVLSGSCRGGEHDQIDALESCAFPSLECLVQKGSPVILKGDILYRQV